MLQQLLQQQKQHEWGFEKKNIYFYHYKIIPTCSHCGPCSKDETECPICKNIKGGRKKDVFREQKHLVLKHEYFNKFWDDYYMEHLQKYQKHFWKMIVLGKKNSK